MGEVAEGLWLVAHMSYAVSPSEIHGPFVSCAGLSN